MDKIKSACAQSEPIHRHCYAVCTTIEQVDFGRRRQCERDLTEVRYEFNINGRNCWRWWWPSAFTFVFCILSHTLYLLYTRVPFTIYTLRCLSRSPSFFLLSLSRSLWMNINHLWCLCYASYLWILLFCLFSEYYDEWVETPQSTPFSTKYIQHIRCYMSFACKKESVGDEYP